MRPSSQSKHCKYDVALSFAGEDRHFVEETARLLREAGVSVFYDKYEEAALWGKDLYAHLSDVYGAQARFTIAFISAHYARKLWTTHERRSAQARAFEENSEYLLPARFDDTPIAGIPTTIGYVDLRTMSPAQLSTLMIEKLSIFAREHALPAHEVVEHDGVYWPASRPEVAMIDVKLHAPGLRVAINPSAYKSLQALLDTIFTHYLVSSVNPYSYGSQWILIGDPFSTRTSCPLKWIHNVGRPTVELSASWASKATLFDEGIVGGSYWTISALSDHVVRRGFCGVLTNNSELVNLLTAEAKAIAFLVRHSQQFHLASDWQQARANYRFQLVFRDWLGVGAGNIFIDNGSDIPEEVRQIFIRG